MDGDMPFLQPSARTPFSRAAAASTGILHALHHACDHACDREV